MPKIPDPANQDPAHKNNGIFVDFTQYVNKYVKANLDHIKY